MTKLTTRLTEEKKAHYKDLQTIETEHIIIEKKNKLRNRVIRELTSLKR